MSRDTYGRELSLAGLDNWITREPPDDSGEWPPEDDEPEAEPTPLEQVLMAINESMGLLFDSTFNEISEKRRLHALESLEIAEKIVAGIRNAEASS